jgi:hypothetical protein
VDSGSGIAFFIPLGVTGIPLGGASTYERLEVLCVVARDGRLVVLWPAPQSMKLDVIRRDAIISTLSKSGTTAFAQVDGPCGVSGTVEWSAGQRSRVIAFLSEIPAIEAKMEASDLATVALLSSRVANEDTNYVGGEARLLVSAKWRNELLVPRPRFLTAENFARIEKLDTRLDPAPIIASLPEYASGTHDPLNVRLQTFCLINADGRAIWKPRRNSSYGEIVNRRPPFLDWKEAALQLLRSRTGWLDDDFPCVPGDTQSWTEDDRTVAVSFLEAIHEPVAECVLDEIGNPSDDDHSCWCIRGPRAARWSFHCL